MTEHETLLKETIHELLRWGKQPYDIIRIGSFCGTYGCTWEEFQQLADFYYDDGYGITEVATDLIILFRDGTWFERESYDGAESWVCRGVPPFLSMWDNPEQINSLQGWGKIKDNNARWEKLTKREGEEE